MIGPEERRAVLEIAERFLATANADGLLKEIIESGMEADLWADRTLVEQLFALAGASAGVTKLLARRIAQLFPGGADAQLMVLLPARVTTPAGEAGHGLRVDGVVVGRGDRLCVPAPDGHAILVAAGQLGVRHVRGLDPDLGVGVVSGVVAIDVATDRAFATPGIDWRHVTVEVSRMLSCAQLGAARAALQVAIRHVTERRQFGRPIGTFQAVRHRLADAYVELAGASTLARALALDDDTVRTPLLVRAEVGRAARACASAAQQVCGAMGFTDEFGLHRLVRRIYMLDSLLVSSEEAPEVLGALILDDPRHARPAFGINPPVPPGERDA